MHLDLRPLTVSEYLDRTFSIYRHRFLLFVGLMAPQAVLSLLAAMLWGWVTSMIQFNRAIDSNQLFTLIAGAGVGFFVFTIVHWVLYVLGLGATAAAVSDLHGHLVPDVGSSFSAARHRIGSLLWLTFLMAVRLTLVLSACMAIPGALVGLAGLQPTGSTKDALAIAGIALLVLGLTVAMGLFIWMGLRYAVAVPAVMLEPIGGRKAIIRSIALTRDLKVRAFLLMLCATMVAYAAMMILQMPFMIASVVAGPETRTGFWLNMTGTATGAAGQALTAPLIAIGVTVLYFEARVRHEALDLQVMTDALGPAAATPPAFATAPPPLPH